MKNLQLTEEQQNMIRELATDRLVKAQAFLKKADERVSPAAVKFAKRSIDRCAEIVGKLNEVIS